MTQLAIKVRGEVLSSNFDEWKLELIAQIQAVNTELVSEVQFAQAQIEVKRFKSAEQALKKTKESVINQASDIQQLFSAIDEISEEVRQVRLSLERQVKHRKLEIKEEFIERGVADIRDYIETQDADFQTLDHSDYLDRGAFETAIKRRASIAALSVAIDELCVQIRAQIDHRADSVKQNAKKLESLPVAHQALFQDRGTLVAMSPTQLDETIDQRIEVFERQMAIVSDESKSEPQSSDMTDHDSSVEAPILSEDETISNPSTETFMLTIELRATPGDAKGFFRALESAYTSNPLVRQLRLERV